MKFYIRIVLLAAFLTSLLSAHAQSPTITWDSTVKDLGDSNYEVVFTGKDPAGMAYVRPAFGRFFDPGGVRACNGPDARRRSL